MIPVLHQFMPGGVLSLFLRFSTHSVTTTFVFRTQLFKEVMSLGCASINGDIDDPSLILLVGAALTIS